MNVALNQLPFSQACENNKAPIAKALREVFEDRHQVLEIGSGTGQHALYFNEQLPHLHWQCSDESIDGRGLIERIEHCNSPRLPLPLVLDVYQNTPWPENCDAIFSANTLHIMHWDGVIRLWEGIANTLPNGGKVAIYGPFNYGGMYTSKSNRRFHASLKSADPGRGIRDFSDVNKLAFDKDFLLFADITMPANNRLVVWQHKG